ncbi:MaoC like domain protein [Nocardioides dokdonensis FR1436]|uniref:MaoC like domain protein n=1 Tax=Nocardioides dokdonensis FR1436 TaxID=1300347 RepID=A0A1A9GH69_9ACTN|nr:MaoC/PaaZ C-terminal domain-containing protein [Nocardioides dokdonensis]ANH37020.1 MaoC like domain protein [Nocardioides dokdonensis FR1436]
MSTVAAPGPDAPAGDWLGVHLGERTVGYDETRAILYALAVGAAPDDLDLVLEDRLRVLPTFALTLAQWAPDALGRAGAFDVTTAVHGSQRLEVLDVLPRAGELDLSARVTAVWDKGTAAVFDVTVESRCFLATWSLFAPGRGGFGGERGPRAPGRPEGEPTGQHLVPTAANQAVLYRLLGDRHHMHVVPQAARAAGQPRPFLHGLASLVGASLPLARSLGAHPADVRLLEGRFAAPVFPGDVLEVDSWAGDTDRDLRFAVTTDTRLAISGGALTVG